MIRARNIRKLMEECRKNGDNFQATWREKLGIKMKEYPDGYYPHSIEKEPDVGVDEVDLRELAEEFLGTDWVASLHNRKTTDKALAILHEDLNPVLPSQFSNIGGFNQVVGGLIERAILQGYQLPGLIGDQVCETQPTSVNGGKLIGIPRPKSFNNFTLPGEEMPSAGLTERWAIAQPNLKAAEKLSITKEVVVYDRTGELLASAESLGQTLALAKESMIACTVMGINLTAGQSQMLVPGYNGNTYVYDGQPSDSANNTYQAVAGTGASAKYNYANLNASTTLVDWKSLQTVNGTLNLMREYETGFPIMAELRQIIVSPQVEWNARAIVRATTILPFSGGGTTNFPTNATFSDNVVPSLEILKSTIWNKLLVDNGFSQSNADAIFYGGDFRKAFVWRELWPLDVAQANPSSAEMMAKQIVNSYYCSLNGRPVVRDPRYVVCNGGTPTSPS